MQFISDPSTSLDVLGATFLLPARNNNITYHHQCGDWTVIICGIHYVKRIKLLTTIYCCAIFMAINQMLIQFVS